ncbi:Chymotrypsin, partial [Gryllus bimaculatus]
DAGFAYPPLEAESRVIGGTVASQGQIPWQAALVLDGAGFCGGSLISSTYVLTAAHCTAGITSFQVTLGASNIQTSQTGTVVQTTRNKIQHASYNPSTINNDIALLRLSTAVSSTSYIRTIRLPRSSQASNTFQGSTAIVSGFGRTSGTSGISPSLRYASLTVISNTNCALYFGNSINSYKVCTTGASGRSPCNGDSGGPLFITDSDGSYTQIGLVSFGSNGCLASYPAVFTRLTSYLSWISSNTGIAIQA